MNALLTPRPHEPSALSVVGVRMFHVFVCVPSYGGDGVSSWVKFAFSSE